MKHESLKVLVDYAQPSLMFINECDCCCECQPEHQADIIWRWVRVTPVLLIFGVQGHQYFKFRRRMIFSGARA